MSDHHVKGIVDMERDKAGREVKSSRYLRPTDTAKFLKPLLWHEFELSRAAAGWVTASKAYEVKLKLGRLTYLHIRHAESLQKRIIELPGGLGEEKSPQRIREVYERLASAPSSEAYLAGYRLFYRNLLAEYDEFLTKTDPVLDAPSIDQIRIVLLDRQDILAWLDEQLRFVGLDETAGQMVEEWTDYAAKLWNTLKSSQSGTSPLYPAAPNYEPVGPIPEVPAMDEERFPPLESHGGTAQAYSDDGMSPLFNSVRQMVYINATEISPAETMTYLYYSVQNMPLTFYYDFARHMWDEFRHSEMGMRRLQQFGFKTTDFKWLRTSTLSEENDARYADMYAWLTMVAEACSFAKKRKAVEAFWKFGDSMSAIQTEFDIVDERLHVDFGTQWGPELYKQVGDMVTPKIMAERARKRRLEELQTVQPDEIDKLAQNFPAFCGFHTSTLEYGTY
ncbi:DUF455 family protein [Paenibacillus radicis (ex Xue et al. 2023)]|uniref:DUF455 family protein n=1 Tax=Paenibacillus radicis (ex Xue et al. 2023) TaxID=2972489 RepID=A0ABT1YA34_9BACL|nr:DUF455 family protein [Paenibacillus radicis (ex Xue et al. 2023)]MCR8630047.1 DUF455 family protein [Paenibacillus radicis (ex Xue et al. 2023)]